MNDALICQCLRAAFPPSDAKLAAANRIEELLREQVALREMHSMDIAALVDAGREIARLKEQLKATAWMKAT